MIWYDGGGTWANEDDVLHTVRIQSFFFFALHDNWLLKLVDGAIYRPAGGE